MLQADFYFSTYARRFASSWAIFLGFFAPHASQSQTMNKSRHDQRLLITAVSDLQPLIRFGHQLVPALRAEKLLENPPGTVANLLTSLQEVAVPFLIFQQSNTSDGLADRLVSEKYLTAMVLPS